jgi:1-acyl-sn-glycerol-3-phosphate acyltransferase
MSSLETYLLPQMLTTYSSLMVILKESLAHYPLFGQVVRAVRPIRVSRARPIEDLRKVLTEGVAGIREGRSVLVFPEGHRMARFDAAEFNTMGVKLALRAGVPVVPVAVRTDFLTLGKVLKDVVTVHPRNPVHLACGPVLPPSMTARELQEASTGFIASKLAEWERETGTPLLAEPAPATT